MTGFDFDNDLDTDTSSDVDISSDIDIGIDTSSDLDTVEDICSDFSDIEIDNSLTPFDDIDTEMVEELPDADEILSNDSEELESIDPPNIDSSDLESEVEDIEYLTFDDVLDASYDTATESEDPANWETISDDSITEENIEVLDFSESDASQVSSDELTDYSGASLEESDINDMTEGSDALPPFEIAEDTTANEELQEQAGESIELDSGELENVELLDDVDAQDGIDEEKGSNEINNGDIEIIEDPENQLEDCHASQLETMDSVVTDGLDLENIEPEEVSDIAYQSPGPLTELEPEVYEEPEVGNEQMPIGAEDAEMLQDDTIDESIENAPNQLNECGLGARAENTGFEEEETDRLAELQAEREYYTQLRDRLLDLHNSEETDSESGDASSDSANGRIRIMNEAMREARERDTEEVLDNYRENLREYGVGENAIEEYISTERDKMREEYEALDRGDENYPIYHEPTDWSAVADSLLQEDASETEDLHEAIEEAEELTDAINYDEIYEGVSQEALESSFEEIEIEQDPERLEESLSNFTASEWERMSLDEQKDAMEGLADYVKDVIGFEKPPRIEYYNNPERGDYGGYDPATNTLHVNEYMLYENDEAADTIAHELWHAHQHELATDPHTARDYQYQYNFANYISPSLDPEGYRNQLVEAEARAFADQFKERLHEMKGRSR